MSPITLRTTSSNPGMARSVWSAALSAGCSQAVEEMSVSTLRSAMSQAPSLESGERLLDVLQQIVRVFHSAREPHHSFRDSQRRAALRLDGRVRHARRMADQALDSS